MIRPEGQPILTAAAMRAAEERSVAAGSSVGALMERAGAGVAEAVRRLAAGSPVLVLCGPGNNGGDGYVAARILAANGIAARVAALGEPGTEVAAAARRAWTGLVEDFAACDPAPIVVDALFGTGARPLVPVVNERLAGLVQAARLSVAVDLPSGLASDTGGAPGALDMIQVDLTLALGALKPAHVLHPAAEHCGTVRVIDIGLGLSGIAANRDRTLDRPWVAAPYSFDHKYSRGFVVVIGGDMPGAAALAAEAAMHAGAGYVLLFGDGGTRTPHALVRRDWSPEAFAKALVGKRRGRTTIVVGPGLGKDAAAAAKLDAALSTDHALVIDGDALHLLGEAAFARIKARGATAPVVLTPHGGEFAALFGDWSGSKIDAARDAAARSGATIVFKGPDTVVARPDGRTTVGIGASPWLSTAGTGDVLAGAIATMLAAETRAAAEAGVWLHTEAARRLGGAFIADDLARELAAVRASL